MADEPQLIYWRGGGEVRADVLNTLQGEGYDLKVVTSFDAVLTLCRRQAPHLIVVDASAGENEASVRVVELSGAQPLANFPILFLSYQAAHRCAVLTRQYKRFLPVDLPFSIASLLKQLREFVPSPSPAPQAVLTEGDPASSKESIDFQEVDEGPSPQRKRPTLPPGKVTAIAHRNKILLNLDPSKLASSYGGEIFSSASKPSDFDDALLYPAGPQRDVILKALAEYSKRGDWMALHARRVTFISAAVATTLGIDAERERAMRTAAVFLNWGLRERGQLAATVDLFFDYSQRHVAAIVASYQASNSFVRERLNDPEASEIIMGVAAVLDSTMGSGGSYAAPVDLSIQTILATELADRAAWGTGFWDPFGAHRTVRKLIRGVPITFDQSIIDCFGRIFSEASSSRQSIGNFIPEGTELSAAEQQAVEEANREARDLFSGSNHLTLQVPDLRPGMRLARPLISWDGKLMIRANTELNRDIIQRLWQAAIIRPLRPPITIVSHHAP